MAYASYCDACVSLYLPDWAERALLQSAVLVTLSMVSGHLIVQTWWMVMQADTPFPGEPVPGTPV